MKKFLCFALVLCLALAPVGVFADENDNGDNAYNVEDEATGDTPTYVAVHEIDEATDEATDEPTVAEEKENGEEVTDEATDEAEGIVAISADLGQEWAFGKGGVAEGFSFAYYVDDSRSLATYADGLWVSAAEDAEAWAIDAASGNVTPVEGLDAVIIWYAKADGLFYLTGSFIGNGSTASVLQNSVAIENIDSDSDLHLELELAAGDELAFVTSGTETANWSIVIREVVVVQEEAVEEVEEVEAPVEELPVVELPVMEIPAELPPVELPVADPLANVPVRDVDGVQFVAFRLFANAFGYYALAWDGATSTVTVVDVVSFTVVEAGGFNDNGTVYVPMAFALTLFQ